MKLDEAIKRYTNNAEYERAHGNLKGCLEFKQLCKWLKELRAYRTMYHKEHVDDYLRDNLAEQAEVVIKIPKYYLKHPQDYCCLAECVRRGVQLPKEHGAIKDVSNIQIPMCEDRAYERWFQAAINAAPTIIKSR